MTASDGETLVPQHVGPIGQAGECRPKAAGMTSRVASIFPTPVYTAQIQGAPDLNRLLGAMITRQHDKTVGVSRSNIGGWQSDIDMMRWGGEEAQALGRLVISTCETITSASRDGAPVAWHPEMWANINRAGDSNQSHWHPGSYLSFVYYVDDGYDGNPDRALGGELVFIDPRMPFLRMRSPTLRYRDQRGKIDEQETWVRPVSGLLIGFPSFLSHSVRAYRGTGTRISIAINMIAREISG